MRLDLFLYTNGYTDSRRKAQTLIADGQVYIGGRQITKAAYEVPDGTIPEIRGAVMPYVGRGGYKLERALDVFGIRPEHFVCADIGASPTVFCSAGRRMFSQSIRVPTSLRKSCAVMHA